MTERPPETLRIAIVVIVVTLYAILLTALVTFARREAGLATQVAVAESAALQAVRLSTDEVQSLRSSLAAAQQRLVALQARFPSDLQAGVFDRVAQDATRNGIIEFRYQRKNDYPETMQAGTYRVYRFTIQGRGRQAQVMAFLDGLLQDSGPATILENVALQGAGSDWLFSADILVYTLVLQ